MDAEIEPIVNELSKEYLGNIISNVDSLLSLSLLSYDTGHVIDTRTFDDVDVIREGSQYYVGIVKCLESVMENIDTLNNKNVLFATINYGSETHILRPTEKRMFITHVVVDSKKANLGMVKAVLNDENKKISEKFFSLIQANKTTNK